MSQIQHLLLITSQDLIHTPAFDRAAALAHAMQLLLHIVAFDYLQALAMAGLLAPDQIGQAREGYLREGSESYAKGSAGGARVGGQ
jgi:universal stress protein E